MSKVCGRCYREAHKICENGYCSECCWCVGSEKLISTGGTSTIKYLMSTTAPTAQTITLNYTSTDNAIII